MNGGINMRIELFKKLCANFNKEPNEDLYLLWNDEFNDYDPYYLELAIHNIIRTEKFFPTISRVLEVLKELPYEEIPTEEKIRRMKERGIEPNWLNKAFQYESVDEETKNIFDDFQSFIKCFRES